MHRSVRLLKPAALTRTSFQRPATTLSRSAFPSAPILKPTAFLLRSPVLGQPTIGVRWYTDKNTSKSDTPLSGEARNIQGTRTPTSGSASRPAENPHGAEQMNATTRAIDEVKSITRDLASMIQGSSGIGGEAQTAQAGPGLKGAMAAMETSSHSHGGSVRDDFVSITKSMVTAVPTPILYFGLAGTLPYLGTSIGIIALAREANRAAQGLTTMTGLSLEDALANLHTLEHVQITYGAIILSFLGALHWGMEFAKLGGAQGYSRLALGTIPVLFAWPTTFLSHAVALAVQWFGFTGMWMLDQRASTNGWTTSWYSTYRFYLSIIVGFSIIATFAGTGYYGAGAGATQDLKTHKTHRLAYAKADPPKNTMQSLNRVTKERGPGRVSGKVKGDVEVDENDSGDAYLKFRNKTKAAEQEEEEEEPAEESGSDVGGDEGKEGGDEGKEGGDEGKEDGGDEGGAKGGDGKGEAAGKKPAAGEGESTGKR